MAQLKNTPMPFFYNSGTIGLRKLKFRTWTWMGNLNLLAVLHLRRGMVQLKSAARSFLYEFGTIDIYGYLGLQRVSLGFLRAL